MLTFKICLLLFIFLQAILANFSGTITFPSDLPSDFTKEFPDGIPFILPNHSPIPYSPRLSHFLRMTDPQNACDPITSKVFGLWSYILVARAGGCSYATKSKNAQIAGAQILIIVHDQDGDLPQSLDAGFDAEGIILPSVLIGKEQGEKLIEMIESGPLVRISFPFEVLTDIVKLDFWFSASKLNDSQDFLDTMSSYVLASPEIFKFTPHFVHWTCLICKQLDYNVASENCISGGRYCTPNPDEEGFLKGVEVIYEDLRQACIWRNHQETWWKYVGSYAKECLGEPKQGTPEGCSYRLLAQVAKVDQIEEIKRCVEESFIAKDGVVDQKMSDNRIFAAEMNLQLQYDIVQSPTLLVNYKRYQQELDEKVFFEICSKIRNPPKICNSTGSEPKEEIPEKTEDPQEGDNSSEPKEGILEKTQDPLDRDNSSEPKEEISEKTEDGDNDPKTSEEIPEKPKDPQEEKNSPKLKEEIQEMTEDPKEGEKSGGLKGENPQEIWALFVLFLIVVVYFNRERILGFEVPDSNI